MTVFRGIMSQRHTIGQSAVIGIICLLVQCSTIICQTTGSIRLVNGGDHQWRGRVEVLYDGRWGTVCDDDWDDDDARVVCQQMGITTATPTAKSSAFYGQGSGYIWLDDVQCTGAESRLEECLHAPWGYHNCTHLQDAGVECDPCPPGSLWFSNIACYKGFTERKTWTEARAACHSDSPPGRLAKITDNETQAFFSEQVRVAVGGTDTWIAGNLAYPWYWHSSDTRVVDFFWAQGEPDEDPGETCILMRHSPLIDSVTTSRDTLNNWREEICSNSVTDGMSNYFICELGGACSENPGSSPTSLRHTYLDSCFILVAEQKTWQGSKDACRSNGGQMARLETVGAQLFLLSITLGYDGNWWIGGYRNTSAPREWLWNDGTTISYTAWIEGEPNNHSGTFEDCIDIRKPNFLWNDETCSNALRYICQYYDGPSYITVRLVEGRSSTEGRVEIFFNGEWGTVCDDSWDDHDAQVVCRQLGFPFIGARAVGNAFFGKGPGPILLDNVNCSSSESSLAFCQSDGWYNHDCAHTDDAGVICGNMRAIDYKTRKTSRRACRHLESFQPVPPTDHFIQNPDSGEIYEPGGEVLDQANTVLNLSCDISTPHPPPFNFRWEIRNMSGHGSSFIWDFLTNRWVGRLQLRIRSEFLGESVNCVVDVGGISFTQSVVLNVTYEPRISRLASEYQRGNFEDTVYMACLIDSNPPSQIVWLHIYNDTSMDLLTGRFPQKISMRNGTSNVATLNISSVVARTESVQYICKATNDVGTSRVMFHLSYECDSEDILDVSATAVLPFLSVEWNTSKPIEESSSGTTLMACQTSPTGTCQTVSLGSSARKSVFHDIQACSVYTITIGVWNEHCWTTNQVRLNTTTPPITPREMGIDVLYAPLSGSVKIHSISPSSSLDFHAGVCFDLEIFLVRQWKRLNLCLDIGDEAHIAENLAPSNIWVIACCMNECSQASPVLTRATTCSSSSTSAIVIPVVIVICALVAVVVIFYMRHVKKSSSRRLTRKEKLVKHPGIKTIFRPYRDSCEYDQISDITAVKPTGVIAPINSAVQSLDVQSAKTRTRSHVLPELPSPSPELQAKPSLLSTGPVQGDGQPPAGSNIIKTSSGDACCHVNVPTHPPIENEYEDNMRQPIKCDDHTCTMRFDPEHLQSSADEDEVFARSCQTEAKLPVRPPRGVDDDNIAESVDYENLPHFRLLKRLHARIRRSFVVSSNFREQPALPKGMTKDTNMNTPI